MRSLDSRRKIERAKKHITDLRDLVMSFFNSDFYTAVIDYDVERRTNHLCIDINDFAFPAEDCAVIVGDALHNLRSSLDVAWHQTVLACGGTPTKWTRFPVYDTRDGLVSTLDEALKQKRISKEIVRVVLDDVKPYEAGNKLVWALHELNIRDKHELLIPVAQFTAIWGIRLEDSKNGLFGYENPFVMDSSCSIHLRDYDEGEVKLHSKGHATGDILFKKGVPLQGEPIFPALRGMVLEVERVIDKLG